MFRDLTPPKLNLSRRPHELPLEVDMEAFFAFSFEVAEGLEDLVSQYQLQEGLAGRRVACGSGAAGGI